MSDATSDAAGPEVVDAYLHAVNAADLAALLDLFTDDAVLDHPVGTFTGQEALAGFYRDVVFAGQAVVDASRVDVSDDGRLLTAELSATSPLDPGGAALVAIDVFHLAADGRIERLQIEYR